MPCSSISMLSSFSSPMEICFPANLIMFSLSSSSSMLTPSDQQWRLDNSICHHQNPPIYDSNFLHFPPPDLGLPPLGASAGSGGDFVTVKKLNHNASERDRRKKINYLYSALRSLLPSSDQMKKLSNPATISRVVKYVPELQRQVEVLRRKKEEILARTQAAQKADEIPKKEERKMEFESCYSSVCTNRLNEREIVVQVWTKEDGDETKKKLSEMLALLEKDGLLVLNASSLQALQGRLFFNLHLQVDRNYTMKE